MRQIMYISAKQTFHGALLSALLSPAVSTRLPRHWFCPGGVLDLVVRHTVAGNVEHVLMSLVPAPILVCPAMQSLAGDNRRLQSGVAQLERELVAREGQLSGQAGELTALQEAQRDAHAQMNQYVMDLQVCHVHARCPALHSMHPPVLSHRSHLCMYTL